jgi:large subunit ribosomal protein L25
MSEITVKPIEAHSKGELKRLRKSGWVPVTLQHRGEASEHFIAELHGLEQFMRQHGETGMLDVVMPGKKRAQAIVHDIQRDPISRRPIQITLQKFSKGEAIKTHIAIVLSGTPQAVSENSAILEQPTTQLEVKGDPQKLPEQITVDISGLTFDTPIRVSDLAAGEYQVLSSADNVIASLSALRKEEEPEVAEPKTTEVAEDANAEAAEGSGKAA